MWSVFQSCLLPSCYDGQSLSASWVFLFIPPPSPSPKSDHSGASSFKLWRRKHSDISSRGWFLIDPTISLTLWNKQALVASCHWWLTKGWTAIYQRIWPIKPPFAVVPAEGCGPWITRVYIRLRKRKPVVSWGSFCLPRQGWHGPGGGEWGCWSVCSTDRLWHFALVIFVTKCLPAYGLGQFCHNLARQSPSQSRPAALPCAPHGGNHLYP